MLSRLPDCAHALPYRLHRTYACVCSHASSRIHMHAYGRPPVHYDELNSGAELTMKYHHHVHTPSSPLTSAPSPSGAPSSISRTSPTRRESVRAVNRSRPRQVTFPRHIYAAILWVFTYIQQKPLKIGYFPDRSRSPGISIRRFCGHSRT